MSARRSPARPSAADAASGLRVEPVSARGLRCPGCSTDRMTRIGMTLTDGSSVEFVACQHCEYKVWRSGEGPLELSGVLDRARKVPSARTATA